jgi:uncharacterized protein YbbK (DUF523 family)
VLERWRREQRLIPHCPEVAAGLGIPRAPVELIGGGGRAVLETRARAVDGLGVEVTEAFLTGAQTAVELCQRLGIQVAVLKERSPSCGSACIHDGTFSGVLITGEGVTAAALRAHGVSVFSEEQWELAQARLGELEASGELSAVIRVTPVHRMKHPED